MAGDSLAALGVRALVITGARRPGDPAILVIDEDGTRLEDGSDYWGLGGEAVTAALRAEYGADYVTVTIGPGGERQLGAAGIVMTDANGEPFRLAARGGLGAVMGSKGLKAILIRRIPDAAKPPASGRSAIVGFHKLVAPSARVQTLRQYGTASTLNHTQHLGGLPTRNFSQGQFEGAEAIGGEALRDTDPGARRGRDADRGVHDGLRDPMQQHLRRCGGQTWCRAARVRDAGAVRVEPRPGFVRRHRAHQPGLQ